jgi:hypothetical protein
MFEALESRQLLSAVLGGGAQDAPYIISPPIAQGSPAISHVDAQRQDLRELIQSRRTAVRQLIKSIREVKGDADTRATLKAQLADLKAQFKADIASARSELKELIRRGPIPEAVLIECF